MRLDTFGSHIVYTRPVLGQESSPGQVMSYQTLFGKNFNIQRSRSVQTSATALSIILQRSAASREKPS